MKITYDPSKRIATLELRGVDFDHSKIVFKKRVVEFQDTRHDYSEKRMICYGFLEGRLMMVGYVQRGEFRHIFTMRKANEREQKRFTPRVG